MGDVVPFIARVRETGDWSAAERSRLQDLADRLAASGVQVEVIFGTTDAGDPWCVVKDEHEDVLIHVARIGGKFVVHSAVDDALTEGADLHATLRERLASEADDGAAAAVVVPFGAVRQAQTFIALIVAAAFFHETAGVLVQPEGAAAPAAEAADDTAPAQADAEGPSQEREVAVQGAASAEPPPAAPSVSLLAMAGAVTARRPADEPNAGDPPLLTAARTAAATDSAPLLLAAHDPVRVVRGTGGDDRLAGGDGADWLLGGAGNDTLRGGALDTLDGGAGDDRLELGQGANAFGGDGADEFVILAPEVLGRSDTLLGVINDFDAAAGDRIVAWNGRELSVSPTRPGEPAPPTTDGFGPTTVGPGVYVEVDLDGDGVVDGYIIVNRPQGAPDEPEREPEADPTAATVGQSWSWTADPLTGT